MAENKKSFVLYADLIKSIDHLTNEEKGILFNHLLEYVNDMKPILTDRVLISVWKPIELQLKRDLVKFEEVKEKRSEAGKISAELRRLKALEQQLANSTSVESVEHTSTNSTVNDNVNVNVNDNVITIKAFSIEDAEILLLSDQNYLTNFERMYKVEVSKIPLALSEFKTHLKTIGEDKKRNLNDFKRHFANWVRVKKQFKQKEEANQNKDRL